MKLQKDMKVHIELMEKKAKQSHLDIDLDLAMETGKSIVAIKLVHEGADINYSNGRMLLLAVRNEDLKLVEWILQQPGRKPSINEALEVAEDLELEEIAQRINAWLSI